eukprot:2549373-Pleurochrysis_carterae.AAC.2
MKHWLAIGVRRENNGTRCGGAEMTQQDASLGDAVTEVLFTLQHLTAYSHTKPTTAAWPPAWSTAPRARPPHGRLDPQRPPSGKGGR